jgi:spore photoproduct lyase
MSEPADVPASRPTSRPTSRTPKSWLPRHVQVTAAAAEQPHTAEILRRLEVAGVDDVRLLRSNRLMGLNEGTDREIYARAKATMAVVVAPPSAIKPQPIPPSADWRVDLARGCPAHCQYCYLAGSLQGPPVTRVHANLDDVLAGIGTHVGRGTVTSGTAARGHEGTTFELSCYTDPLALEHLTGSLATAIERVGTGGYGDASLRFTTKFDAVDELLALPHHGRTRMRVSVNSDEVAGRFEGGTAAMPARLVALRRMAEAGYPVGLTVAPIMPSGDWRVAYARLLDDVAAAVDGLADLDLTVEAITHRFTDNSKEVLQGWYPRTRLEMDEAKRTRKRTKFGGSKYVYPRDLMSELRTWFGDAVSTRLPGAPLLYWT